MSEVSDELLMAYVDGQLGSADLTFVERALARDPGLAHRMRAFEATRDELPRLFNQALVEPVPNRVVRAILGAKIEGPQPTPLARYSANTATAGVGKLGRLLGLLLNSTRVLNPVAVAGALLLTGTAGWIASQALRPAHVNESLVAFREDKLVAGGRLLQTLEKEASNKIILLEQQPLRSLRVLSTFKSIGGGFCREFEVAGSENGLHTGVGCRQFGQWHIQAYGLAPKPAVRGSGVTVAGNARPTVADATIENIIDGPPFDLVQEAQVIARGWRGD